ncbi:esterase/lipase family protein [Paremcibacter congregatus]|uniref:esterase/lipase family protein n=1 Tax=Paremcibacter congregatus TaxID=2043170 RepID=UPI003A93F59C
MNWNLPEHPVNMKGPTLGGKYVWSDIYLLGDWHIQKNVLTGHHRLLDGRDIRQAWGSYDHCLAELAKFKDKLGLTFPKPHIFLLLHGLARHKKTMTKTAAYLREKGHAAYCLNYPSTFQSLDAHADDLENLLNHLAGVTSVSFIGHSLGGLLARELLRRKDGWRSKVAARHLMMLGTPNNGARIADMLGGVRLFHTIAGPSGQDVMPVKALKLPPPDIPTLVIAGGRNTPTGYNPILGEDNDGIVTVGETRLEDMTDFRLVNVMHTTIMDHPETLHAIEEFIAAY